MRDPGIMPGNLVLKIKTTLITGGIVYCPDTQHASNAMFIIPKGSCRPHRASKGAVLCGNCDIITRTRKRNAASFLDEIQQPNDSLIFVHFLISSVNEQFDQAEL